MKYPTTVILRMSATNLLANYIALKPGIPKRMHFTDHYYIDRQIMEKELGKMKPVRSLTFWVDEEDGQPVARTYSVLSQKLAAQLEPHLKDNRYRDFDVTLTEFGQGYSKDWTILWQKRPEPIL